MATPAELYEQGHRWIRRDNWLDHSAVELLPLVDGSLSVWCNLHFAPINDESPKSPCRMTIIELHADNYVPVSKDQVEQELQKMREFWAEVNRERTGSQKG